MLHYIYVTLHAYCNSYIFLWLTIRILPLFVLWFSCCLCFFYTFEHFILSYCLNCLLTFMHYALILRDWWVHNLVKSIVFLNEGKLLCICPPDDFCLPASCLVLKSCLWGVLSRSAVWCSHKGGGLLFGFRHRRGHSGDSIILKRCK